MNTVAVTGSHGFIGSILRKMLTEQGLDVLACDINLDHSLWTKYTKSVYHGSFDDDAYVDQIVRSDVSTIFHLAATSTVGPDAEDPMTYYWNNTARTITFLKKLIDSNWKGHIIFASTAAVYRLNGFLEPKKETYFVEPASNYGRSKLQCERILDYCSLYGINVTSFRFFNVAGAYDEFGEEHQDTHLISRICVSAINNSPVTVYGDDYPTPDGTCIRDYVHVLDICRAQCFAAQNKIYGTYNLGSKQGTSVFEMIDMFNKQTGCGVTYETGQRRPGDVPYLVAEPTKFTLHGFMYKYNIEDIIDSSWKHFKRIHYGI